MNNTTVTIFTPTYNRDKYITNLYNSLCDQTIKPLEWIVVDQGNDKTKELIKKFMQEAPFPVIYRRLDVERGISRAFNLMINIAKGTLVMKVDDDDTLSSDAIQAILEVEASILKKDNYAGVGGLRSHLNGKVIGRNWKHKTNWIDCTNLERSKYSLDGDKAEAYYLGVFKEYGPMPNIPGEYYTWEGVLYDRIAHAGKKIRWFNKKIYYTEYLTDGATKTRIEAREKNFFTYSIFVSERMKYNEIPLISRLKLSCRYFELLRKKGMHFNDVKSYFINSKLIAYLSYFMSIFTKYIPQNNIEY